MKPIKNLLEGVNQVTRVLLKKIIENLDGIYLDAYTRKGNDNFLQLYCPVNPLEYE